MQVDILEAKSKWFELVQRAGAGEEVVIAFDPLEWDEWGLPK